MALAPAMYSPVFAASGMRTRLRFQWVLAVASVFASFAASADAPRLIFQTGGPWSPRVNVPADMVLVYGVDASLPERIRDWRAHGYRVAFMTGVAWGHYPDYLDGRFDGDTHWDETQQKADGSLMLHTGRDTPYFVPTPSYASYLAQGVLRALDSGAEAVYLEEPEFWAESGWSTTFKAAWQQAYGEPWQPPNDSAQAQWRASQLKYQLYRETVATVCGEVHRWGHEHGREVPCNVATHSLLNYAQWHIVSPETSFVSIHPDGFIGQVWTGTARATNSYDGVQASRPFVTAFLEYGFLVRLADMAQVPIWLLADPVEDDPARTWQDYQADWKATLVASLMQSTAARFEVLPWPNRIFNLNATYANGSGGRSLIPADYQLVLQTVFHALSEMPQGKSDWLAAGTPGVGILVSDSLMFERAGPAASDPLLGHVYGLALPLLREGVPVTPVPMESTYLGADPAKSLRDMRMVWLSYRGQTPPSPQFTQALVTWVKQGGALAIVDDGGNGVEAGAKATAQLLQALGASPNSGSMQHIGKGVVAWLNASPADLSHQQGGAERIQGMAQQLAETAGIPWGTSPALVLRRGDYVIAAGLPAASQAKPVVVHGRFIDLLNAKLPVIENPQVGSDALGLFRQIDTFGTTPGLLAASGKVSDWTADAQSIHFALSGIEGRPGDEALAILTLPHAPAQISVNGAVIPSANVDFEQHVLRLHLPASAAPVAVEVKL
jgi:hypothetical protein